MTENTENKPAAIADEALDGVAGGNGLVTVLQTNDGAVEQELLRLQSAATRAKGAQDQVAGGVDKSASTIGGARNTG